MPVLSLGVSICLDRESRHWQKLSLNSGENLDSFKKLVSRSRNLDCLDTTFQSQKSGSRSRNPSRPKILVNLESLSRSQSRVS